MNKNRTLNSLILLLGVMSFGDVLSQWSANGSDIYYNSGNIGIGTVSPGQKLEIYNPNLFNTSMDAESQDHISFTSNIPGNGNFFGGITWKTGGRRRAAIAAVQEHTDSDFIGLAFFTKGTDGPGPMYESVRITRNGSVGIGTTSPDAKLHVYGNYAGQGNVLSSIMIGKQRGAEIQAIQEGTDDDIQGLAFRVKSSAAFADPNFEAMRISRNGNVGIGTTSPDSKLAVNGNIHAKEVKVDLTGWPDYVLEEDHDLPTLEEVEKYIKEKGHLINIPSAKEVEENGIELGEMNKLLLEKIEELTLYTIKQENELESIKKIGIQLGNMNVKLMEKIESLTQKTLEMEERINTMNK